MRPRASRTFEATRAISYGRSRSRLLCSASASMFEPRPEMRTPTRIRSITEACAPCPGSGPGAGPSFDDAARRAVGHPPDVVDRLASGLERGGDLTSLGLAGDHDHADAAVEGPCHLFGLDI